jgi:hypothetical protein
MRLSSPRKSTSEVRGQSCRALPVTLSGGFGPQPDIWTHPRGTGTLRSSESVKLTLACAHRESFARAFLAMPHDECLHRANAGC